MGWPIRGGKHLILKVDELGQLDDDDATLVGELPKLDSMDEETLKKAQEGREEFRPSRGEVHMAAVLGADSTRTARGQHADSTRTARGQHADVTAPSHASARSMP